MKTRGTLIAALAGIAALIQVPAALAADVAAELSPPEAAAPPASGWTFSVAPYFWAAGLSGDVGVFGLQPVDIDMSFGDIFDDLRFGGMVAGEAHNGTWGLFGDVIYVKTEADSSITRTIAGVPVRLGASVETSSFTGTFMGEYRVLSNDAATVDLMAGIRVFSVDNDIDVTLSAGERVASLSGSDGATWVDPIVGARARYNINPSWYLTGWGMIGGFDASSKITWDVMGGVGYQWNDWLSLSAGYRALGVDYENDGFVYDVIQQGPILGAVMRF
jgi:opacity protein-like surface antigen